MAVGQEVRVIGQSRRPRRGEVGDPERALRSPNAHNDVRFAVDRLSGEMCLAEILRLQTIYAGNQECVSEFFLARLR